MRTEITPVRLVSVTDIYGGAGTELGDAPAFWRIRDTIAFGTDQFLRTHVQHVKAVKTQLLVIFQILEIARVGPGRC